MPLLKNCNHTDSAVAMEDITVFRIHKEDFNKFSEAFTETVNHVKSELMPEYDFDEYTNREDNNDY